MAEAIVANLDGDVSAVFPQRSETWFACKVCNRLMNSPEVFKGHRESDGCANKRVFEDFRPLRILQAVTCDSTGKELDFVYAKPCGMSSFIKKLASKPRGMKVSEVLVELFQIAGELKGANRGAIEEALHRLDGNSATCFTVTTTAADRKEVNNDNTVWTLSAKVVCLSETAVDGSGSGADDSDSADKADRATQSPPIPAAQPEPQVARQRKECNSGK
eukprot:1932662-Pyramimonas_sp.AAC.1